MSRALKLGPALRELRIHLCQKSENSAGVRNFIEQYYVPLKKENPKFPILIRECKGIEPRIWARYDMGRESSLSLANLKADDVFKQIEKLAK